MQTIIEKLLEPAGITINGPNPWDIQVKNPKFFKRVLQQHSLGLGESYMDGWWDCPRLDETFCRIMRIDIEEILKKKAFKEWAFFKMGLQLALNHVKATCFNLQKSSRAFKVGEAHYDIGNDLFEVMLDSEMNYTCGYWKDAQDLEQAQRAKLDLVCQKLQLKPGQRVLDIGCGWGAFARHAASQYDVEVTGVTISKEQKAYADRHKKDLPIVIELKDYREIKGKFDHVVSLGMFEHVGYKNYDTFMKLVHDNLEEDGLCLLHTIGSNKTVYTADAWTQKYIFPNGMLPSIAQIGSAAENYFIVEDLHNFGAFYDKTLMAWYENFITDWESLKENYDGRFYRMWTYYLLSCAGTFRARAIQLWQWVLTKKGLINGYQSIR